MRYNSLKNTSTLKPFKNSLPSGNLRLTQTSTHLSATPQSAQHQSSPLSSNLSSLRFKSTIIPCHIKSHSDIQQRFKTYTLTRGVSSHHTHHRIRRSRLNLSSQQPYQSPGHLTMMKTLFSTCSSCSPQSTDNQPNTSSSIPLHHHHHQHQHGSSNQNKPKQPTLIPDDGNMLQLQKCAKRDESNPRCWSCPDTLPKISALFCSHCGVLQPPVIQDHYALFDIPRSFDIDPQQLESKFLKLQQKVHPDLFNSKSKQEQSFSLAHASEINASYEILKDPLARARYLLSLSRPDLLDDRYQTVDGATLMEIMERREVIEDSSDPQELARVFRQNSTDQMAAVKAISEAFKTNDMEEVSRQCQLLSYYYSMHKDLLTRLPSGVVNSAFCDVEAPPQEQ